MNSIQKRMKEHLNDLERLLLEADNDMNMAYPGDKRRTRKIRCAINDACNALHRGVQA